MRALIVVLAVLLPIGACTLMRPDGPTRAAIDAGNAKIAESLDRDGDGVVSAEELREGTESGLISGDWEYLIWIISLLVFGEGGRRVGKVQEKKAVGATRKQAYS